VTSDSADGAEGSTGNAAADDEMTDAQTEKIQPGPNPDPEQAWKALSLVNDWVKHAEAKTGATLAAAGVTGGVLYNLLKSQADPPLWLDLLAVACGLATFAAGACALVALTPRLQLPRPSKGQVPTVTDGIEEAEENPVNLLFYRDIARRYRGPHGGITYAGVLGILTDDRAALTRYIARQVHANAAVAHRKYVWVAWAIRALGIALVLLAVTAALIAKR